MADKVTAKDIKRAMDEVTTAQARLTQAAESEQEEETISTLRARFRDALVKEWSVLREALELAYDGAGRRRAK